MQVVLIGAVPMDKVQDRGDLSFAPSQIKSAVPSNGLHILVTLTDGSSYLCRELKFVR